jgi:hypothetical protein
MPIHILEHLWLICEVHHDPELGAEALQQEHDPLPLQHLPLLLLLPSTFVALLFPEKKMTPQQPLQQQEPEP